MEGNLAAELDPLSPQILLDAEVGCLYRGNIAEAKRLTAKAAELAPDYFFSSWSFGQIELEQRKPAAAVEQFRKSKSLGAPPFVSAWLGYALAASGNRPGALAELEVKRKIFSKVGIPPFNLAMIHLGLGDRALALGELERAYASDSEWLAWLKYEHIFDPLRNEPRFTAMLKKIRLAQ